MEGIKFACFHCVKGKRDKSALKLEQMEIRRQSYFAFRENVKRDLTPLNIHNGVDIQKELEKALKSEYYTKKDKKGRLHEQPRGCFCHITLQASPGSKCYDNEENLQKWMQESIEFIKEQFPNCPCEWALHRDEKTAHIHFLIIPITKSGKISVREFVGTKKKLRDLHTEYADKMQHWGLERGFTYREKRRMKAKTANLADIIKEQEQIIKQQREQMGRNQEFLDLMPTTKEKEKLAKDAKAFETFDLDHMR